MDQDDVMTKLVHYLLINTYVYESVRFLNLQLEMPAHFI